MIYSSKCSGNKKKRSALFYYFFLKLLDIHTVNVNLKKKEEKNLKQKFKIAED